MLVKVNDSYLGSFGLSDPLIHTVTPKRAGDPPFEVPDDSAAHHIKIGVLIPVEVKTAKVEDPEPVETIEPDEPAPVIEPAPVVEAPKAEKAKATTSKKRISKRK